MVNDYCYRENHYSIVYDGRFYMTVNHKFIGDDGCLTRELTFKDGLHPGDTIADCIERTRQDLDMDYYVNKLGLSKPEALSRVMDWPLDMCIEIYAGTEKILSGKK